MTRPTLLLVHGYMNDRETEYLRDLTDAILAIVSTPPVILVMS